MISQPLNPQLKTPRRRRCAMTRSQGPILRPHRVALAPPRPRQAPVHPSLLAPGPLAVPVATDGLGPGKRCRPGSNTALRRN